MIQQGIYMDRLTEQYIVQNCSEQPGELQVFYLFGKEYNLGGEHYYVVRAAMEAENEAFRRGRIQFSYSLRTHLEQMRHECFQGLWLMGWAVNQPGHGVYDVQKYWAMHDGFFGDCPVFILMDGRSGEKGVYYWDSQQLQYQQEYHLFEDPRPRISQDEVDFYETRGTWIS